LRKEINTIKEIQDVPTQVKAKLEQLDKTIQKTQASVNKSYKEYQDLKTEKKTAGKPVFQFSVTANLRRNVVAYYTDFAW
jgi:peptidoglycan hydrolase CwlO-like protein